VPHEELTAQKWLDSMEKNFWPKNFGE